jgi:hypothetical protein
MRTFIAGGVILIFIFIQLGRGGNAIRTIDGDGSGYYAYLTSVFIHHTTDFTAVYKVEKERRGLDYMAHYFHKTEHGMINKYYLGTALMILPFFLLAWLYSVIIGMPADGYTILFQYAVSLSAAVYLAIGLLAVRKLLSLYDISKKNQIWAVVLLLFGTNLFYYAYLHPSHSHVYSFAAISVFLLFSKRFFITANVSYFMIASLVLGLVALIRPTNAIVVFALFFIAGSKMLFVERVKPLFQKPSLILVAILLSLSVFMLQPLFNFIQTGDWFLWSYRQEGFRFNEPALLSFLFSYRKGFFIYTPLMLLVVPALVLMYQRSFYLASTFFGYLFLLLLLLSSWWNWFFGDSFGMRAMIDHYALLLIPVAMMLQQFLVKPIGRWVMLLFLTIVVSLNLVQTYQYYTGILHPDSMSKEKYWYVFMKTSAEYRNIFGSYPEPVFTEFTGNDGLTYLNDMESPSNFWTSNGVVSSASAYSGSYLAELNQSNIYSPTLVLSRESLPVTQKELYVSVNLMFRELVQNATSEALLVYASTGFDNQLLFYKTFKVKQIPDHIINEWCNTTFGFKVPAWTKEHKQVKIYVWNKSSGLFQLDDFEINIYPI